MPRSLLDPKRSVFCLLLFLVVVHFSVQTNVQAQNKPILLKGGVEHSESLPALPPQLQPGAVFQRGVLGTTPATEGWRRLPNCMAGGWEDRNYTLDKFQNFVTGATITGPRVLQKYQNFTRGYQMDSAGDIWDFPPGRTQQTSETSTTTTYISVRSREVLEITHDRLVERANSLQIEVSVNSHRIVRVIQAEQIAKRQCVQPGIVHYTASIKSYTAQGAANTLEEQHGDETRVRDFASIGTLNGVDLKSSFNNYLVSHGLENLVPKKF